MSTLPKLGLFRTPRPTSVLFFHVCKPVFGAWALYSVEWCFLTAKSPGPEKWAIQTWKQGTDVGLGVLYNPNLGSPWRKRCQFRDTKQNRVQNFWGVGPTGNLAQRETEFAIFFFCCPNA